MSDEPVTPAPINGKIINVGIGMPAYGARVSMWQTEMWLSMGHALANAEHRFKLGMLAFVDVCGVEVARNKLVAEALDKKIDWLLMVDADTWHPDGYAVLQMISDADRQKAAVVAAPVPRRGGDDTHLMVYRGDDGDKRPLTPEQLALAEGLTPIDSAATALMGIDVNFVKTKFQPPWFRFEWKYGSMDFTSEDVAFCRRVREAGGKVMADGRFVAKHLNRPVVL